MGLVGVAHLRAFGGVLPVAPVLLFVQEVRWERGVKSNQSKSTTCDAWHGICSISMYSSSDAQVFCCVCSSVQFKYLCVCVCALCS